MHSLNQAGTVVDTLYFTDRFLTLAISPNGIASGAASPASYWVKLTWTECPARPPALGKGRDC